MPFEVTAFLGEQDALLKIDPTTKKGNPAQVELGKTKYVIDSAGNEEVQMAADEKSARVVTVALGDIVGHIDADADLGEGIVPIGDTFVIHVVSPQAENLGASGEAVDKIA